MHDLSTQQAVFPATLHQKTTRPFFMATPNRTPSAPHPRPGMKTCRFGPCLAHCQIGPGPPGVQTAEVPAEAPLLQRLQRFRMGRTPVPAPRRRKYSMVVTIVLVWNWDNSRRNICIYIYIWMDKFELHSELGAPIGELRSFESQPAELECPLSVLLESEKFILKNLQTKLE